MTPVGPVPPPGSGEVQQTIHDSRDRQFNFDFTDIGGAERQIVPLTAMAERLAQSEFAPTLAQFFTGVENIQKSQPGSKPLDGIRIARDDAGWVSNRVDTYLKNHPELLDQVDMRSAAEVGAKLAAQAQEELAAHPGMKVSGGILDVAPDAAALLERHWIGKEPLATNEAAFVGAMMSRELQHAVTPTPPDTTSRLQWVEDGTAELLTFWPGALSKTVEALGIKVDAKELEKVSDGWRKEALEKTPTAATNRSLVQLLGSAGIDMAKPEARDAAFAALQGGPLEQVPLGIAQAIVAANALPPTALGLIAGRIVETDGVPGNIGGLLAEIAAMKQPKPPVEPPPVKPPVDPPPVDPPPVKPPVDPPPVDPPPAATMTDEVAATIAQLNAVLQAQGMPPIDSEIPPGKLPPPVEVPPGEAPPADAPPDGQVPPDTPPA